MITSRSAAETCCCESGGTRRPPRSPIIRRGISPPPFACPCRHAIRDRPHNAASVFNAESEKQRWGRGGGKLMRVDRPERWKSYEKMIEGALLGGKTDGVREEGGRGEEASREGDGLIFAGRRLGGVRKKKRKRCLGDVASSGRSEIVSGSPNVATLRR